MLTRCTQIVEALPKQKAPGPNGIIHGMRNKMPLIGRRTIFIYLYLLIKSSMHLGALPVGRKTAIDVMLPKTLKPESPSSKLPTHRSTVSDWQTERDPFLLPRLKEVVERSEKLFRSFFSVWIPERALNEPSGFST
jgi:hypothetical protein